MPTRQAPVMKLLNPLVARLHSRLRYPRVPPAPRCLFIETTSRCNLNCLMCPRQQMRRPALDMSEALFHSVVDQAAEYDRQNLLDLVALHGFGEPLMHPQFLDFVEYAGARLPRVRERGPLREALQGLNVSSNALLLDEAKARALLASKLTWLAVSVDGCTAGTYEAMRRGGRFEQVKANVQRLLEINRQRPRALPTISIQMIATRTTLPEFEQVATHWREQAGAVENVRIELKPYTTWAGQVQALELADADARAGFFYLHCGRPYNTIVINADGGQALCCYDVQAAGGLGNANDTALDELWRGARLNEIRRKLAAGRAGELPLCRDCAMTRKYPGDLRRR